MRVCQRCSSVYPTGTKFCGIDGQELKAFTEDPLVGKSVGRYTITALMGRGGCGSVYKVMHSELKSEFALKVLYGNLGADARYVERFRREAQVVSKIRSPWVVSVVDFGTSDTGLTYLVMEYCDGVGLDTIIQKEKTISPVRAARFTAQIASALSVAHKLGLVHRDVKPANVMVQTQEGKEFAKLLDFGIVRTPDLDNSEKLTQEGVVMGTPPYMAPEQASGSEVTAAADLYSLGIVLFQMLTGMKPFTGTASEIFDKHRSIPPPPMPVTGAIADLCYSLLAKKPAQRPESAALVNQLAKKIEHDLRGGSSGSIVGDMSMEPGALQRAMDSTPSSLRIHSSAQLPGLLSDDDNASPTLRAPIPKPLPKEPAVAREPVTAAQPVAPSAEQVVDASAALANPAKATQKIAIIAGSLAVLFVALLCALLITSKQDSGPVASVPLPGPSAAQLEGELNAALGQRGFALDELANIPETKDAYAKWQSEKSAPQGPAVATLSKLIEQAKIAPMTEQLLTARLDKLDPLVAAQAAKMPPGDFEALKVEYLDLYRQLGMATAPAERDVMAKAIARFETNLRARP